MEVAGAAASWFLLPPVQGAVVAALVRKYQQTCLKGLTASYLLLLLVIYLDSKLAFGMGFPDNLLHTSCCHCKSY